MPRGHPTTACRGCERPLSECGKLSRTGLCADCGEARRTANLVCLVTHRGPYFDHWRLQCLASFGVAPLDETPRGS